MARAANRAKEQIQWDEEIEGMYNVRSNSGT